MHASVAIQVLLKAENDKELVRIVDEVIAYIKLVYEPEGEILTIDQKVTKHPQE